MLRALFSGLLQRSRSETTKKGGLGLGLYLARQLALAHGGDLLAESPPGRGAHFVLRIPLEDEDEPDARTAAT